jgi:hypothetical protein
MQTHSLLSAGLSRWQRVALVAWITVGVMAVGRAALVGHPRHVGCYPIFAEAGRHWLAGEDLYEAREGLDVFRYSPLVAAFFTPFGALPDILGSALLRLVNLLVFGAGLAWWMRSGVPICLTPGQRAGLWLLALPLAVHSLVDVQTNALAIGFILLAFTAAAKEHWSAAALLLALACAIKVYPLALVLLLTAVYPRRMAIRSGLAVVLILGLPFVLQRADYVMAQYRDWLRWGLNDRHFDAAAIAFRDFRLLCSVWLTPLSERGYRIAQLAAAAVVLGICIMQRFRGLEWREVLVSLMSLGCAWMMVFGPATEHTTYIFLAPALAWAFLVGWLRPSSLAYRLMVGTSFVLFTATQLCLWFPGGSRLHQYALHPIAGMLLMAAWFTTTLRPVHVPALVTELARRPAA